MSVCWLDQSSFLGTFIVLLLVCLRFCLVVPAVALLFVGGLTPVFQGGASMAAVFV